MKLLLQVAMARKIVVESLEVEGRDQGEASQETAPEQRQWVVSVPLERRSKSSVA